MTSVCDKQQILITYLEKYEKESKNCDNFVMENPIPDEIKDYVKVETTTKFGFLNFSYLKIDQDKLIADELMV
jgi:hypothetical protein